MLNKSGQQLQHFCHAVTTMCDIFRGDLNLQFKNRQCIVGTMLHLEKSAHSFFERCTRAYRSLSSFHCLSAAGSPPHASGASSPARGPPSPAWRSLGRRGWCRTWPLCASCPRSTPRPISTFSTSSTRTGCLQSSWRPTGTSPSASQCMPCPWSSGRSSMWPSAGATLRCSRPSLLLWCRK
jgi:hypothetical protein